MENIKIKLLFVRTSIVQTWSGKNFNIGGKMTDEVCSLKFYI